MPASPEGSDRLALIKRLQELASALLGAASESDLAAILVREATETLGAKNGLVMVPRPDGTLETVSSMGLPAPLEAQFQRIPITADLPIAKAFRTGTFQWFDTLAELVSLDPDARSRATMAGTQSGACIPLMVRSAVVGAMGFGFVGEKPCTADDREYIVTLGGQAAIALDRLRTQREAEAARDAAEAANRAKDEFLAILGHELRNPLAPIVTALQLQKLKGGGGTREHQVIERQVMHLQRLVDDLLDISRITRGDVELHKEPLRLSEVATAAIEKVSSLIDAKHHQVEVSIMGDTLVDGDRERLDQVVSNLLTNAARYTDPGGRISITIGRDDEFATLRVTDNGAGIDAASMPTLFDAFVRGSQASPRDPGALGPGLGLGLALVKNLMRLHGGDVIAQSEGAGRGSEFTIRIPVRGARPAASTKEGALMVEERGAARARVLVVDDNQDAADLLGEVLRASGCEVMVAYDGPQALSQLAQFTPDVGVLDIGMPGMDGYELARRLREKLGPRLRMFALTGYGQERDRQRTKAAGFDRHFVKPADAAEIAGAIFAAVKLADKPS